MSLKQYCALIALAVLITPIAASAIPPPAFYLAGDSTTAAQSDAGGGWGVGFLKTLTNKAIGTDLGYNGATTVSFVHGGAWANVIDAVTRSKGSYDPYVTIQFGHNDQKVSANISIEEYSDNLKNFALEVKAAGGTPILVTPLSRRNFNSSGLVTEDLAPQRLATIAVAKSLHIDYIDLNEASTKYLDAIGEANSATYNRIPSDFTHLNPTGSVVFGDMVSWLLTSTTSVKAKLKPYTRPDETVVRDIERGVYVFPRA
ncbi:SGNH hydrolase-type esterase domain-containing protein [Xylogone sp. PMI_703]|nr:SGNH hydrolase-type esterase domain-containing protein [Xylogone sp. PMI_703]